MLFDCIVSTRNLISGCCYDVVYRWEDVISRAIGAKVVADERKQDPKLKRFGESSLLRLIYMFFPWVANSISTGCNCLVFELDIWRNPGHNKKNGTTANCRKRRSIDLRFLRYEGLTAVA